MAPAAAELLGDLHPLLEQIGSPDGVAALAGGVGSPPLGQITTAGDLRMFLENYHAKILQPIELPAIQRAFSSSWRDRMAENSSAKASSLVV